MAETMTLGIKDSPEAACVWLEDKGYNVIIVAAFIGRRAGLVFAKGNEASRLAVIGQTLEFNDKTGKVRVI